MRLSPDCIPCFMRQALEASRMATGNEVKQGEALRRVALELSKVTFDETTPEVGHRVHRIVREVTGNDDPYLKLKDKYNRMIMAMYPDLKRKVAESEDKLLAATRLAIAGNIIDFGPGHKFDLEKAIEEALTKDFAIDHFVRLKNALDRARKIFYLGDNTGEIVFDRVLLEELGGKEITFVVKGGPILNDATVSDAKFVEIDKIAEIGKVSNGMPGTGPERNSKEFIDQLKNADVIISKGQGNYEALSEASANIFFMLRAKCPVIARDLGVEVEDIVIKGRM